MNHEFICTYRQMLQIMNGIAGNSRSPEWIFWMNVCELIESSEVVEKNDCIGTLAQVLNEDSGYDQSIWYAMHYKERSENYEEYLHMVKQYIFADSYGESGEYWKFLLVNEDTDRLEDLSEWLYLFYKKILPAVYKVIGDWEYSNNPKTMEDISESNKKAYTAFRRKVSACKKSLDQAVELYHLKEQFHLSE